MSIATSTVTVNAAFLQEIKNDDLKLRRLLSQAVAISFGPGGKTPQPKRLAEVLRQLNDRLTVHFSLEETFGYFEDAVTVAPHLSRQAESLRAQHKTLLGQIRQIADDAGRLLDCDNVTEALWQTAMRFDAFHEQLLAHEAAENDLIFQAFHDDVGVTD